MSDVSYESFKQLLDRAHEQGGNHFPTSTVVSLIRLYPENLAELARVLVDLDLGPPLNDSGATQRVWRAIAQGAPNRVTQAQAFAQWEAGAYAMLNALNPDQVPYEFAQDCMADSGQPLHAARCLGVLTRFCQQAGGEAEVDQFWQHAGEQLLVWAMKMDELEAVQELTFHAHPTQGLGGVGKTSWVQAWVQARSRIPYLFENQHNDMLAALVAWGAEVDKTHTNVTTLALAAQDVGYPTRCRETIHGLMSAGAAWEHLDCDGVDPQIRNWLHEHPRGRQARLDVVAQDSRPTSQPMTGPRKI